MITEQRILDIIITEILAKYEADSIWLYGSRAGGKRMGLLDKQPARPDSDYDVLIMMPIGSSIKRHDYNLNQRLWTATGCQVNAVFATQPNSWQEKLIYSKYKNS